MAQTPSVIIEYLEQLGQQPPDVPGQLMQALAPLAARCASGDPSAHVCPRAKMRD